MKTLYMIHESSNPFKSFEFIKYFGMPFIPDSSLFLVRKVLIYHIQEGEHQAYHIIYYPTTQVTLFCVCAQLSFNSF